MPSAPVALGSEASRANGPAAVGMRASWAKGGKGPFGAQGSVGYLGVVPTLFRMASGADDALHAAIGLRGLMPNWVFGASGLRPEMVRGNLRQASAT